jgi:hypothetical protein
MQSDALHQPRNRPVAVLAKELQISRVVPAQLDGAG